MRHAFATGGVNFFDNAECYGVWTREDLVLTTKIFMGMKSGPIEETVRAVSHVIDKGWAFFWGTSEWSSHDVMAACEIADRLGLIRPVVEQPQYNIFERSKVEFDHENLYRKYKTGLTTFSPLAYSVLAGKYADKIPSGSRLSQSKYTTFVPEFHARVRQAEKLRPIAQELGCSMAQLALAWCASNPRVSSVIIGASSVQQLDENLAALAVIDGITPEIKQRIDAAVPFTLKRSTLDTRYSTMRDKYFL